MSPERHNVRAPVVLEPRVSRNRQRLVIQLAHTFRHLLWQPYFLSLANNNRDRSCITPFISPMQLIFPYFLPNTYFPNLGIGALGSSVPAAPHPHRSPFAQSPLHMFHTLIIILTFHISPPKTIWFDARFFNGTRVYPISALLNAPSRSINTAHSDVVRPSRICLLENNDNSTSCWMGWDTHLRVQVSYPS